MKRILCLFFAVTLIFALVGCAFREPTAPTESHYCGSMTEEIRRDVMLSVLYDLPGAGVPLEGDGTQVFDSGPERKWYYIGTVQGYIVLLFKGNGIEHMRDYLGQEIFLHNDSANLYLYKNHTMYLLEAEFFTGRLTSKKLFYKLAACLYQYQVANGREELYERWGYVDYADRYREALPSNTVPLTIQEKWNILYALGKYYGCDMERPGEGNQLFADKPLYYLGEYNGWYVTFYMDESLYPEMLQVGQEVFWCSYDSLKLRSTDEDATPHAVYLKYLPDEAIGDEELFALAKRFYQFRLEHAEDPDAVRQLYGDYATRYESP